MACSSARTTSPLILPSSALTRMGTTVPGNIHVHIVIGSIRTREVERKPYVTHSGEGEGLLFFGNVILPFVDHFPKDLELYS